MSVARTRQEGQDQAMLAQPEASLAVEASNLCKSFDDRLALSNIRLNIPAGSMVVLLGANGAGKTTLLKILAGLIPPTSGELRIMGSAVDAKKAVLREQIGMIAHQPMLYRDLSAMENLMFFGRLYAVDHPRRRAEELLAMVGLADRCADAVSTLSRGMTQRLAIARALMHDPQLLLADEPFDGLDAPSSRTLENLLRQLRQQGKTIILSVHDIRQGLDLADEALLLREGRAVLNLPARQVDVDQVLREMSQS